MKHTKMAAALKAIADSGAAVVNAADGVLSIVKAGKLRVLEAFDEAVKVGYEANGWQTAAGRPKEGTASRPPVPSTVKTYVSLMRAAYRAKLPVLRYRTFSALRSALAKTRSKAQPPGKRKGKVDPALAGIRVLDPGQFTGAPFHDLAVGYQALPKTDQEAFLAAANRLLKSFQRKIPASVTSISERRLGIAATNGHGEARKVA